MSNPLPLQLQYYAPLCHSLPLSNLQSYLPYCDQDLSHYSSKANYLIKTYQKQQMASVNPYDYINDLKLPEIRFINSEKYKKELERVKNKINKKNQKEGVDQQHENSGKKDKKNNDKGKLIQFDIEKFKKGKLTAVQLQQTSRKIDQFSLTIHHTKTRNMNIQLSKQFSPLYLKQLIIGLDKQKQKLIQLIQQQKQQICSINKNRKYDQLQARQREETVEERIKVMVNKKRKLE